jgi:DNA polymerase bacteriophage-type
LNYRFNIADENAIETRVGAWLAECAPLLDVFRPYNDPVTKKFYPNGKCPYISFAASYMYGVPYETMWADYKGFNGEERQIVAKARRQIGKPAVLGPIYRLGGGKWEKVKKSKRIEHVEQCPTPKAKPTPLDKGDFALCGCPIVYDWIRGGLWGYAWNMGVEMEQEQAHFAVRAFREAYAEICGNGKKGSIKGIWVRLEEAVMDVMRGDRTVRYIGPNNAVKIFKQVVPNWGTVLKMQLPSGRCLHYLQAQIKLTEMPWTQTNYETDLEEPVYQECLWYMHQNQTTNQWELVDTQGGKLFENLVQAIARDVLAAKLLKFEEADMPVVGHVHDEGISLVPDDPFSPGVEAMVAIMSEEESWASGLLLGADGFESKFYRK